MSGRELIVLGTASQTPTRTRAHNACALRWDDQLLVFDPGEGTQRQCTLAGVAIARATGIFVTHFHGDHCLGLPGVIQRRSLDNATNPPADGPKPLPIWYPADGQEWFDRLRHASIFNDHSHVDACPVDADGAAGAVGDLQVTARLLDHRTTAYGWRLDEPSGWRVDTERALALGAAGPRIGQIMREGSAPIDGRTVTREQIADPRPGQSFAFVMDTRLCDAAAELADGVDMLVIESTYLDEHRELADRYLHMTARQAGELAAAAGVRRLVLTHFSARYTDAQVLGDEAAEHHGDVVVGADLQRVAVPSRT